MFNDLKQMKGLLHPEEFFEASDPFSSKNNIREDTSWKFIKTQL